MRSSGTALKMPAPTGEAAFSDPLTLGIVSVVRPVLVDMDARTSVAQIRLGLNKVLLCRKVPLSEGRVEEGELQVRTNRCARAFCQQN